MIVPLSKNHNNNNHNKMESTSIGTRSRGLSQSALQQHQKQLQMQQPQQQTTQFYHDDNSVSRMNNSPGSPLFPHFPPPPEYPPPHGEKISYTKQRSNSSHRYPDDLDVIEICIEPDPDERGIRNGKPRAKTRTTVNYAKNAASSQQMGDQPVRWSRNNIAVTMERFEPSPTSSITPPNSSSPVPTPPLPTSHGYHTMSHHHSNGNNPHHHPHEYSYAYYEPGAHMSNTMRQTTLQMAALSADPGPSRPPPPNSMRALLNTASRKNSPNNRHMYINHYGTQENVYEEIANDPRMRIMSAGSSMVSLNQSLVEEEFRRIQSRHRRILGELNLSVEAMLMPETPPSTSPTHERVDLPASQHDNLNELLSQVGPTDELLSPVSTSAVNGDMDSGFSGSSSSASYVGSLRYHRTNGGTGGNGSVCGTQTRSSTPSGGGNASSHSGSIRSSQRSTDDSGITTTASRSFSSVYEGGKCATKKSCDDTEKPQKISFWSRKGWRKIPGFSSTTSVNKAGLANVYVTK
ncbi:lateral signaling target protein 2 homolog [Culicoides brevitarsis]|uniref:lateral signaling target protein 2 homolog n=1 Tax=Culicoides brevitarsis TaxID=469753 RepID=UPI00307B9090